MEIKETKTDKNGKQREEKVQMPDVGRILNAINQRGMFSGITRYQYLQYDVKDALKIVEAIGKSRNPSFVLDNENRFVYENFVKWVHCDTTMMCLNPDTKQMVPGRLKRGIYIAGNTGTGKSWCLDIMLAYAMAWGFRISLYEDKTPRPLFWKILRADAICEQYADKGSITEIKKMPFIGIQDFGNEPRETMYMGNRIEVMRQLIEFRGDKTDELTFITSNLKINGEPLTQRYGDRVASRLMEMCNYFELRGKDRRRL